MDTVFIVISMIIVFVVQLLVCFKSKSRTARTMPAALFLLASNAWLFNQFDPRGYDTLGFTSPSFYLLFCAMACGLAWAIYGIVRLIVKLCCKKSGNKESDIGIEKEPAAIREHTQRRKILSIVQIVYIVLVFLFFLMQGLDSYSYTNSLGEIILFLYVSVSVVINSIALVFVVKSIVIAVKQLIQSKQYLRLGTSVVLVISVILSVWNGLAIYAASAASDFAIDITDENREKIESLIATERKNDIPDLSRATKIKHVYGFLNDDYFVIYYEYGTTHSFGCILTLEEYIISEGYNIYLSEPEHTRDLIAVSVTGALSVVSAVTLTVIYTKKRKGDIAPPTSEESTTL